MEDMEEEAPSVFSSSDLSCELHDDPSSDAGHEGRARSAAAGAATGGAGGGRRRGKGKGKGKSKSNLANFEFCWMLKDSLLEDLFLLDMVWEPRTGAMLEKAVRQVFFWVYVLFWSHFSFGNPLQKFFPR